MSRAARGLLAVFVFAAVHEGSARHARTTKAGASLASRRQSLQQEGHSLDQVGRLRGLVDEETISENKIPLILHYVYLSGYQKFKAATEEPRAKMKMDYYDSCVAVHGHWDIKFWTEAMAESLVREHYPWFLATYQSYDMEVKRADAVRPFILHHYGGMYLDLDNECFEPAEKLFGRHDVVLQGSGWEGVNNGMMASAPGHPLWMTLVEVLGERAAGSAEDPSRNMPLYMTGPSVLNESVKRYLRQPTFVSGFISKAYEMDELVVRVYCLGEFYMPCWESDLVCQRQFERGVQRGTWDTADIVGRHWFAGTWNRPHLLFPKKKAAAVAPRRTD